VLESIILPFATSGIIAAGYTTREEPIIKNKSGSSITFLEPAFWCKASIF